MLKIEKITFFRGAGDMLVIELRAVFMDHDLFKIIIFQKISNAN